MAFDDESMSFQPQSPGQALDEETASRSLASLASRRSWLLMMMSPEGHDRRRAARSCVLA